VDALAQGRWQWNAWLTPQGRVRALMHLVDTGDGTLLAVLRGGDAEDIRTALSRYLLRLPVTLTVREFGCRADGPAGSGTVAGDGGDIVLGYGSRSLRLGGAADTPPDAAASSVWRIQDIREGWPRLLAGEPEFLPPALGLEHLQAVSFDKGCYPGQEVAARLRYRGGHKHRLYHLQGHVPMLEDRMAFPKEITPLDVAADDEEIHALAVGPVDLPDEIPAPGGLFRVSSRFGP
jgi:folate-binding protein YgfZ